MGCGTGCIKVLLITFNVIFWIFGLGLLGIGVWLKVDTEVANLGQVINIGLEEDVIEISSWILIGAGIFAFLVGFIGCCGAIKESPCLLGFYLTALVLVFASEIGIAIFVGIKFQQIKTEVTNATQNWLQQSYDGVSVASKGFNYLQMEFCCCGAEDYRDYKDSEYVEDTDNKIKKGLYMSFACCDHAEQDSTADGFRDFTALEIETCEADARSRNGTDPPKYASFDEQCEAAFRPGGCKDALLDWGKKRLPILIGVGAGVAFVQIFVFAITVCLCRSASEEKE